MSATRLPQPVILVRGFGGLDVEDEKRVAYQGFNDGTVYPRKQGENYIYEGMILRFMKSQWQYHDATNVVNYFGSPIRDERALPPELSHLDKGFFTEHKVVIDVGMARHLVLNTPEPTKTLWVFRYYDLNERTFPTYGQALVRLIDFIRALATKKGETAPKVNIVAHSMGGLLVREAIQSTYPARGEKAETYINKVVTLGTPHQGISFQVLKEWLLLDSGQELEHFNPSFQKDKNQAAAYVNFGKYFPPSRVLTVVGTNYKTYGTRSASILNRLFALGGEYGPNYNRSDGLVKQTAAQLPGAPRTFVNKCHGGPDSLVTSRESFEVATRFFFGNMHASLRLVKAEITRGMDIFGKSEFFFGVSIKPRRVDFELFHQSPEAENCYGPFHKPDLSDERRDGIFWWADDDRLIWEGWLDTSSILKDPSIDEHDKDLAFRLDFYVGERDLFGIGFSDNVIFRKQYYVHTRLKEPLELYCHTDERFISVGAALAEKDKMKQVDKGWEHPIEGTGFKGTFRIELENVPET